MNTDRKERRRLSAPVIAERRSGKDRRSCPSCGAKVQSVVGRVPAGTVTTAFCTRCPWKEVNRAVDQALAEALMTTKATVGRGSHGLVLRIPDRVAKIGKLKEGSVLEFVPMVKAGPAPTVAGWKLKKAV